MIPVKSYIKNYIKTILNESLLDSDDSFYDPVNDKKFIEWWINNNYIIHGKLTISDDFVVDCAIVGIIDSIEMRREDNPNLHL